MGSGLVLILGLMSSFFVVCFGIIVRGVILCGSEIWAILCVIVGKINNMLLCVKFMLLCACVMY